MSNLIGQSLGRYHILEGLGEGGMAIVYKAYDTRLESDVAVKVIRIERLAPEILQRSLKRFEREAKALARLTHPNIVKVTDYGEHEGKPYLVMPFLPGGTLKDRLKQGPLTWQECVRLLLPIAEALDFAHSQNMIHRDVKPSNILLTQRGQPMLTDFGIAKILDLEETADLTGTGMGIGTPEYMAPEQWTGKMSSLSDQYSLGVVLYEMLTGRKLYTADTPAAILLKQATEPLPRPSTFSRDLPENVEKLLIKALAKNPNDRYLSMGDFAGAMEAVLNGIVSPAKPQAALPRERVRDTLDTMAQTDTTFTRVDTLATINQAEVEKSQDNPASRSMPSPIKETFALKSFSKYWSFGIGCILIVGVVLILGVVLMLIQDFNQPAQYTIPTQDFNHPAQNTIPTQSNISPTKSLCGGDVSGNWSGFASNNNKEYTYFMSLYQSGCQVTGSSYSDMRATVSGYVENGVFYFSENGSENTCYWKGYLTIVGNRMTGQVENCDRFQINLLGE